MKKLKFIYNHNAGNKNFKNEIDSCIKIFQEASYDISILRASTHFEIDNRLKRIKKNEFDVIVVAGGDGTLNIVVNAIMKYGINANLGIIPSGTANDFARYLKIPKDYEEAARVITNGKIIKTDVGHVNDRYFINVFGAGLLTNISHHVDDSVKSTLGKLAYYLKGIEQIQNFIPMPLKITNSSKVFEEKVYFIVILNSSGAGGFDKLVPEASISDGVFDFLAIKETAITELAVLVLNFLRGEHINNPNVIYFQDSYVKIEPILDESEMSFETDLDGENGPNMPIEIKNIQSAIKVFTTK